MQITDPEFLAGALVEDIHDGLVGGGPPGRIGCGSGRREFGKDLSGCGRFGQPGPGVARGGCRTARQPG
ncbi:hypothetical protein [Streptomyces prasinopilosus]|uniref:hypothetical protein n=1 Tax=Streptomyces prasinopilosus TaxID=67344 RepID=UPI00111213C3|nr:hypothetical protein [Streptomyces prasinopilosus]